MTALVPIHEVEDRLLLAALDSLTAQTDPSWRAVCVAEPERIGRFARLLAGHLGDPRISLVTNEGTRLAGALNTGMRRASTPFVASLLGDDLWSDEAVSVLSRRIRADPTVDVFHSARRIVDADGRPVSSVHPPADEVTPASFATGSPVKHLICWRREMGIAVGGVDESIGWACDDYDFPWVLADAGAAFAAVPECLYLYRDHREGFRLTTHVTRRSCERTLAAILAKHGVDRGTIRRRVRGARHTYLRQCLYRSAWERWARDLLGLGPSGGEHEPYD